MVDVDFIPPKLLHIYYNNRFALQIFTHSQFCTNKLNMEINEKVCTYWFTKKFNKIIAKFHVLLKYPQTTNPNL